jgi:hypothetical protein
LTQQVFDHPKQHHLQLLLLRRQKYAQCSEQHLPAILLCDSWHTYGHSSKELKHNPLIQPTCGAVLPAAAAAIALARSWHNATGLTQHVADQSKQHHLLLLLLWKQKHAQCNNTTL